MRAPRPLLTLLLPTLAVALTVSACARKSASTSSLHPIAVDNKIMSLEIPLARKAGHYIVVDLSRRWIHLKSRGITLREFRILQLNLHRPWEGLASLTKCEKKGLASEPDRTVIDPPKGGSDDTGSVMVERVEDSLELADMPAVYTIEFADKSKILVLPRDASSVSPGLFQKLSGAAIRLAFLLKRAISPGASAATIALEPSEARALYWTIAPDRPAVIASSAL